MDLFYIGIGLLLGGLIFYVLSGRKRKTVVTKDASLLLEKIESVSKLITIEGNYSEVVHFREDKPKWLSLIPNNKRAIVIVKAKALVGFDLTKTIFEVNAENKTIIVKELPKPEVLSIEPQLEYYDIKDSALNRFKPQDHSALQKEAIDLIKKKVEEGDLPQMAIERGKGQLQLIQELARVNGWKVESPVKELPH